MFHPLAARRIGADLPNVKVIAMVRDPVERAYSAYKHEFARGFEWEKSFGRALELEDERLAGEIERILETTLPRASTIAITPIGGAGSTRGC